MEIKTNCCYCRKDITVKAPEYCKNDFFSCNNCVPKESAARDGINEPIYTEISKEE